MPVPSIHKVGHRFDDRNTFLHVALGTIATLHRLRDFFRAVERGQAALPSLLSNLLIRRTRNHVLRFYGHDAETDQRVDP